MSSIVYPLLIQNGDIVITSDEDTINRNAIESSIRTRVDERVRRPDYGRPIEPFQSINDLGALARAVKTAIDNSTYSYELDPLGVSAYLVGDVTAVQVTYQARSGVTEQDFTL